MNRKGERHINNKSTTTNFQTFTSIMGQTKLRTMNGANEMTEIDPFDTTCPDKDVLVKISHT
jgi:hypothetical protein